MSTPGPVRGSRTRSAKRQLAATILVLEAFVVGFAALVAFGLKVGEARAVWGIAAALALSLVLAAGVLGRPGGYVVGSVLQVPMLATGAAVPMMLVIGGIFAVLWVVALRLGGRIDRERQEQAVGLEPADGR